MRHEEYPGDRWCEQEGCERPASGLGMCSMHYQRHLGGRPLDAPATRELPPSKSCCAQGCDRRARAQGMCMGHYQRKRYGIEPFDGPIKESGKRGEGWIDACGYRRFRVAPQKSKAEHRLVMERHIGRELFADETVHHLNGVRLDNRIENLELWSSWHPMGQRVLDKVAWAREVLERYDPASLQLLLFPK